MMTDLFRVGVITSTHALLGEVKVFPTTEDPQRFRKLKKTIIPTGAEDLILHVERVRFFKQYVIVKFREYTSIEQAEKLVKKEMYVTREDAIPLQEGEYYVADLLGLSVVTDEGQALGVLDDVLQTGANDVYVVKTDDPQRKEILLPVIPDCVLGVDLEKGTITVHLLPGL